MQTVAAVILGLGSATVIGIWPYLLFSSSHPERSLTVTGSAASNGSLFPATIWVSFALVLR